MAPPASSWSLAEAAVKIKNSDYFYLFARLLLGGVFLYASLNKITHPQDFVTAVENYRLLSPALSWPLALLLPWIEALAGLFLLLGLFTRACAYVILVLLLVFIGALASAFLRGLDIHCGCFDLKYKAATSLDMLSYIFRDAILVFFACQITTSLSTKFSLANILPPKIKKLAD